MNIIDLSNHSFPNDRALLRRELIEFFLNEAPGTGKGPNASKNQYIVKKIAVHDIYLNRPAQFNNGFDFTLNVSNINFNSGNGRATTRPTHGNILDDLRLKKSENLQLFNSLLSEITNIYNCQNPSRVDFPFSNGYSASIVLECIKWLFVEQDVTYWHYSGRAMFYNSILAI
ncbi:MAG TPA: hypothetical protein VG738_04335 [Chitinophagaceae bacterium]|nr:hypothetical protein [Chitinophagaceae bacterium]